MMNKHERLLKATASATMTQCVTFFGDLSGRSTGLSRRNNRGKRCKHNVSHTYTEAEGVEPYA